LRDLWQRIERCRTEAEALCARIPGDHWERLLGELEAIAAEGRQQEHARDALLQELTLILSCTKATRVLEMIMDSVIRLSGAQRGFLLLQREDGAQEIAAARNMERTPVEAPEKEISRRIVTTVLEQGRPLRLDDALNTPPYNLAESITRLKMVSVLCVPIKVGDQVLGCIYLENRKLSGVFAAETEQLVAGFAQRVGSAVLNAEALAGLRRDYEQLRRDFARDCGFDGVAGHNPDFLEVLRVVSVAAESDIPIVIQGESGAGKELLARAAHLRSPRREEAFVSVNCAALPASLLESELFGHRRGAFTGATHSRRGLFASAHKGTLFLDELGEMPAELQAKLLRVLQSGEFRAVGSDTVQHVDVRIVAATAVDLEEAVDSGRFRQDLFFRLSGVRVTMPPLRARREDIPMLIRHFLERSSPPGQEIKLDGEAHACLLAYDYPGNVRELGTILQRAVLFARDGVIGLDALPPEVAGASGGILRLPARIPATAAELLAAKNEARESAARELERAFLLQALAAAGGRPGEAARATGMNRSQFARMLTRHGLSSKRSKKTATS